MTLTKDGCLRREPADHFHTRRVCLSPQGNIVAVGPLLNFVEMQKLRQQGEIEQTAQGRVFANLGVSLQLIVHHAGRKALVLVDQQNVLKLVSGYVPVEDLNNPLASAWAELMEEVLPVVDGQLFGFQQGGVPLPDPYEQLRLKSLPIKQDSFLSGLAAQALECAGESCGWPVMSYEHAVSASLQLLLPVTVDLPEQVSLMHIEDVFKASTQELVSLFDPDSLAVLMELDGKSLPTGHLFTLQQGQWHPYDASEKQLSEFFYGPGKTLANVFLE